MPTKNSQEYNPPPRLWGFHSRIACVSEACAHAQVSLSVDAKVLLMNDSNENWPVLTFRVIVAIFISPLYFGPKLARISSFQLQKFIMTVLKEEIHGSFLVSRES